VRGAEGVKAIQGEHVTVQIAKRSELHTQSDAQAMDCRTQLCMVGETSALVEKLQTQTQHQFAVHPLGFFGATP